jgi:hypothetical protein
VAIVAYLWIVAAALGLGVGPAREQTLWNVLGGSAVDDTQSSRLFDVLAAPDVVRVVLATTTTERSGQGLAWWSPSNGIGLAVDGLPALPSDRRYQLWLMPQDGPAMSLGTMKVDVGGSGRTLSLTPASDVIPPHGALMLALTEERASGSSRPSSAIQLAGQLGVSELRGR